jgi:predicted PurR-regulated permease PerM
MDKFWSYTGRILVVIAILGGGIWLIAVAGLLLEALIIAALLAYLLDPVVRLLTH